MFYKKILFNIMGLMRNTLLNNIKIQYLNCFTSSQKTAKSRYRNISAFLCTKLAYFANKFDRFLIKSSVSSVLSIHPVLKLSPISADKSWDKFSMLYAQAYSDLGVLRLYDRIQISYHGDIESRMLQRIRITEEQGNVKGTTGVIPQASNM